MAMIGGKPSLMYHRRFIEPPIRKENIPMHADQLRERQAPLKTRYREDPASATVHFEARGELAEGVTCRVPTFTGTVPAGLHPAAGGDGSDACSGDMLLQALAACAGVTLNAVATAMGIALNKAAVVVEGDMDFRGTLGVDRQTPVGYQNIKVRFEIDSDAPDDKLNTLVDLAERYCVVFQTLNHQPELSTELVRISG
jgi:uncharacterized OsmC-like protein